MSTNDFQIIAEPGMPSFVLTRTFDAPKRLVYEACTKPEHIAKWWGPRGTTLSVCEMDFRVGGSWRFVQRTPNGEEYGFRGVYREIVPNERVVQTFVFDPMPQYETLETMVLEEQNGKTRLTTTVLHKSVESRDGQLASGMQKGAAETLERLEELVVARKNYQPGALLRAEAHSLGSRWTLVLSREFKYPVQKIWQAITEPSALREWAPFDAERNLAQPGPAKLSMAGGPTPQIVEGKVLRAEAPRLLEYDWGGDILRWELEPTQNGTRLTLRHTANDRTWLPKFAAGWHICLDVAERSLSEQPIGRIVGSDAKNFGWEKLNAAYAKNLGIEDTGWPEMPGESAP
jgi:uncharacterized protein YndB with AHSA1/START domain